MCELVVDTVVRYEALVPSYLDFVRQHRGRRTTHQLENALGRFVQWMTTTGGLTELYQLTPVVLREDLSSLHQFRRATIAVHASALRGWLGYLRLQGLVAIDLGPAVVLPRLAAINVPPPVWDKPTVERLLGSVDRSTRLGKRDYAMLLLAARYGLRSKDIRTLRLEDIHWREQRIVLVQSKTQQPLELPLLADVDDALSDYLRYGRPTCPAREIFLRHMRPIAPFGNRNNHWAVMARALRTAGITDSGPRRGFHRLRHSLATHLLRDGVALDIISDVLGHTSIDATAALHAGRSGGVAIGRPLRNRGAPMTALTSPFASHIARLRAHQGALGVAYIREGRFLAEFERLTVGWPDDVLSETLVRKYLAGRTEGGRPHRLTVMRALARFLVLEEPRTFVPPARFLGIRRRRPPAIRVLSREEASRFLLACDALPETSAVPRGLIRGTALRIVAAHGSPARRTAGAARSGCRSASSRC